MSHLTILNIFNHLWSSVVYVDVSQKIVTARRKHVLRNILPIVCIIVMNSYLGIVKSVRDLKTVMKSVMEIVYLLKYSVNSQITIHVVCWMYRRSGDVVSLYRDMFDMDNRLQCLDPAIGFESERQRPLKMLILLAFFLRAAISAYHIFILVSVGLFNLNVYLILQGNVFLELTMDLNKVYLTIFAIYLANRYACLEQLMRTSNTLRQRAIFEAFGRLLALKGRLSLTLGILIRSMVLETFVACSAHAYLLMCMAEAATPILHMLVDVGQLTIHLALFYILTYFYDTVERKETELRNALKSIQYINFKDQTSEQKDFYDLINLKLMMDSPKITACGLFEINLQIFYNVFAAIITYIVILFQFRGFEKAS